MSMKPQKFALFKYIRDSDKTTISWGSKHISLGIFWIRKTFSNWSLFIPSLELRSSYVCVFLKSTGICSAFFYNLKMAIQYSAIENKAIVFK